MIPVAVIKRNPELWAPLLTTLLNNCITTGVFPIDLKCAIAFPLHKKGNSMLCDNYRGISVLSPFTKIFERLLSDQITQFFTANSLFSTGQHGFRTNHSCETALQTIIEKWRSVLAKNNKVLALFIDFKKAFDLIDPRLLWLKLFHYGFDNTSLNLMRDYFADRTMSVRVGNSSSSKARLDLGVPQGSILGPLLFIIFINDLGYENDLFAILFADDTTLVEYDPCLETLITKFKTRFARLNTWIDQNKLFINWSKTKFMIVSNDVIKPNYIMIGTTGVEVVDHFKLLGCTVDDKLTFSKHVDSLVKTIRQKLFAIKKIFFLSYKIKLHFFKTFILPHFDYCASLFIYFSKTLLEKILRTYNSCLFNLLKIDLHAKSIEEQIVILSPLNIMPFYCRLFYRLALFSYKILNNQILPSIKQGLIHVAGNLKLRENGRNLFVEPFCKTRKHDKRISVFLPRFCNKILRNSWNLGLTDYKNSLFANLSLYFFKFEKHFL